MQTNREPIETFPETMSQTKSCMICGINGVSVIACNLPPHDDEFCGNFSCIPCFKILQENATICPKRMSVCLMKSDCRPMSVNVSPPMICKCGRKVCAKCYSLEDFITEDGKCQICIEKEVIDELRLEEQDNVAAKEPSAKRAKLGDSNGEAR